MGSSPERISTRPWCIIFLLLVSPVYCFNSTCGDLVTYNQLPNILQSAPTCFKNGCGASPLTSMSTTCDPSSGCFPIWTIFNQKWQSSNDWCSKCPSDRACRNHGWPVLNATSACDVSPNTWLFGNGGCCISGDEPAALAKWIETTCNETWRSDFVYYDGQAKRDWDDYRMAWNWTVRANNETDNDNFQSQCPSKPLYLGLFVIENIVFLLFAIFYAAVTLWIIREKERTHRRPIVKFILAVLTPVKWLKKGTSKFFKWLFCMSGEGGGTGTVVSTILIAILFAGIQLGANFGTAYIIKNTPGYSHVPAPLLALLFCCRPRLGWLACLFSSFPESWLTKYFHLRPETEAFQTGGVAVYRVGVSSAVGEVIMQCLGSYFLGKTAHIGVEKGFYLNNRLTPFYKGMEARNMYIGAMFWLVAAFGVVFAWLVFLVWHAALMHFYATTKSWLRHVAATAIPESVQPRRMRSWRRSNQPSRRSSRRNERLPTIDERNLIGEGHNFRGAADQPEDERYNLRGGAGSEISSGSDQIPPGFQNIRRVGGSSAAATYGSGSTSAYDNLPMRPQDFPQASASVSSASRDSPPRSARNGYQALPVNPEMVQMRPGDFPASLSPGFDNRQPSREDNILRHTRPATSTQVEDPVYIQRVNRVSHQFPDTRYHGANHEDPDEDAAQRRTPSPPYNPNNHFPTTFKAWQPYILGLAFFLGIISYIAQWLFWAGFVYAAGDRFCPPRLGSTGTLWSIAAILGISTNFLS